ncbi:MAG: PPOX class F420-dependent oxidoreductase [Solirubrobacterales bacterium]|nr:PPOX class F420-dependent oxidoreductase [Solirubrobacterales bacterium]
MTDFDEALANRLLDGRYPCVLTTLRPSGDPHTVVTWCSRDGRRILINGSDSVGWMRNVRRDPRVSVLVPDTEDILRYVSYRGEVVDISEDVDYLHMDAMARLYDGTDEFIWHRPDEVVRWTVAIEPSFARTYDPETPPEIRRGPTRDGR